MNRKKESHPRRVAVIYQYFAHYREPVVRELIHNSPHHYDFWGDDHSFGTGIKLITSFPDEKFRLTRCIFIGPLMFQLGAIRAAMGFRYDTLILLGNCKWPTTWAAALIGRMRGKRVLLWTHGWLKKESGLSGWFRNTFYKTGHGLLLYGHYSKCIGIESGFKPERLHVIYNALDCELQDKTRAKIEAGDRDTTRAELFGEHASDPVLIIITRLHKYKKIDMLIDAAAELKKHSVPVNVLIVGDGPHKPELEELAERKGVNAVFAGALYDEEAIGRMFNASDVAVMPGPVGLLVMHALAYGVPVISNDDFDTQMPEFEAIIPGVTGDFFRSNDVDSLVESIGRMLGNPMPYHKRYEQARERIERFYNPISQRVRIDSAVEGNDADDLLNTNTSATIGLSHDQ